jgi:DNA-nicking Smr family endonuclease
MSPDQNNEPVRIPITGELDLHTFRPREIASLLDDYLAECVRTGRREVRLIHGKGTGTLRETVHAWLRSSPRVAGFRLGDESSGGWGATLVKLKVPPSGPAPAPDDILP